MRVGRRVLGTDGLMMFMVTRPFVRAIPKKSIFGIPVVGWATCHAGFVPADRKGEIANRMGKRD